MEHPGLLYVAATLLPLASFVLLLLAGALRLAARPYRDTPLGSALFQMLGGDRPNRQSQADVRHARRQDWRRSIVAPR